MSSSSPVVFCHKCNRYNCPLHLSQTRRLIDLLGFFQEPIENEDNMRSFFSPDKRKHSSHPNIITPDEQFDRHSRSLETIKTPDSRMSPSTAQMVHVPSVNNQHGWLQARNVSGNNNSTTGSSGQTSKLVGGKYKPLEVHHFTKINSSSFQSISAPSGIYSETALILWVENKTYTKVSSDRFRVVITLLYDMEEDLWHVSAKLVKRSMYGTKDDEEQVCNRLCATTELRSEVKRTLLFMGINPRHAYKMFRRNFEEDFNVTHAEYGFIMVECASHAKLMQTLEKPASATTNHNYGAYDYHGSYGMYGNYAHHAGGSDPDKYKAAMMGYQDLANYDPDCYCMG